MRSHIKKSPAKMIDRPHAQIQQSPLNPPNLGDFKSSSPQNWGVRGAKNYVGKKWSFWTVTIVSAIALQSITLPLVAQTNSSQSEQFEAQKLEQQVWELESQGKYSEAIPLAQRALLLWEKALGAKHSTVAYSLNRLATLYKEQGNYSQAEPLYQRALAINEKIEGKDSPIVASILNNLAGLYQYQGNYSGAEQLLQRSLAIDEKVKGKEHPDVATVLNNLALLYQAQNKYSQAIITTLPCHPGAGFKTRKYSDC
jgi:tetratricopeptide (TPR) repeat protein